MPKGWNAKYEYPDAMKRDLEAYFTECDRRTSTHANRQGVLVTEPDPEPYTIAGMALACNMGKSSLGNYRGMDGFREVLEWAYTKMEKQWLALTARPSNNGGAIFYLGNVFKGEYTSQMAINVGGQAGNPVAVNVRDDRSRLMACTEKELDQIEAIMREAEARGTKDAG